MFRKIFSCILFRSFYRGLKAGLELVSQDRGSSRFSCRQKAKRVTITSIALTTPRATARPKFAISRFQWRLFYRIQEECSQKWNLLLQLHSNNPFLQQSRIEEKEHRFRSCRQPQMEFARKSDLRCMGLFLGNRKEKSKSDVRLLRLSHLGCTHILKFLLRPWQPYRFSPKKFTEKALPSGQVQEIFQSTIVSMNGFLHWHEYFPGSYLSGRQETPWSNHSSGHCSMHRSSFEDVSRVLTMMIFRLETNFFLP